MHSLGLAIGHVTATQHWLLFGAREANQHLDLNGDGDMADEVVHVYDSQSHAIANLGIAVRDFLSAGTSAAIAAVESKSGKQDFNSDGDTGDVVLFVYDLSSGALTNTEQSADPKTTVMDANRVVFQTSERAQKNDLNGDGDLGDSVTQVWDLRSGSLTNTGLDTRSFVYAGDHLAIAVREANQGNVDLDDDGDRQDSVLHVFDLDTNTATNLGFAIYRPKYRMVISPTALLFAVSEGRDGLGDLNGDGRANDDVAKIYSFASQSVQDIDLSVASKNLAIGTSLAAFAVPELQQGSTDLNGDGDKRDSVIYTVDLATGTVTGLGVQGDLPAIVDRTVVFRSIENSSGKSDLNSDGDTSDRVLRAYNFDTPTLTTLGTVKRHRRAWYTVGAPYVVFASKERPAGHNDLNGDGDTRDVVMQVYDTTTRLTTNTGFQSKSYAVGPTLLAVATTERNQGGVDQNGDGDTARDIVLNVFDMSSGSSTRLPVATQHKRIAVGDDFVGFGIREVTHFNQVQNGDTDATDVVIGCAGPLP